MKFLILLIASTFLFLQSPFDKTKVAKQTEVNFATSKYRGIESNNVIYYVGKNTDIVTAYHANGKTKWRTDVSIPVGSNYVGKRGIRSMKIDGRKLIVVYAKHSYVEIDISTDKSKYLGSD